LLFINEATVTFEEEARDEDGSLSVLRDEARLPSELFCDHLRNDKAKSDSLGVHLLVAFNTAKQFEELALLRLPNADSIVEHGHHDLVALWV